MRKILNFIAGEFVEPVSGQYLENYEPATGNVYSVVADSDERDIEAAVKSAQSALPIWSGMPTEKRSQILIKIADAIEANLEKFARAESTDQGKPIWLARTVDIPRAAANFRFFATAILHFSTEAHPMDDVALNYTLRTPLGIVGCISPWNLPLYLFTWKITPALATGNCVIGKPSEMTPMTAHLLAEICAEAGLPSGVLNIVHGLGSKCGAALVSHPKISAVSFTGGTKTGADIARIAAPMFKKLSLELGGKNPTIIFADCDFEKTVETVVNSSFRNQGEICLCGSRIFVEKPLYERFKVEFLKRVSALKNGDPQDENTQQGAIVSKQHFDKVLSYIELAKEEGGIILAGGEPAHVSGRCEKGWFIAPTVIEGLTPHCRTNQEEIFGPVVTITPFETEDEVLQWANSTQYGLAASVWTENLTRAHRLSAQIHSGIVWVNCWMLRDLRTPFGGVKQSGVGREGGLEALRFFTEPKNVCIKY
ncbi:MAG TPA: aldehyde dehydrogenase [Patescibacteria group bacterium]|nr:aldehyde dehydrogenase [Patescibacteria group bacterium]